MNVLVLGATGQVGRELMRASWVPRAEVVGLSRNQCDITDASAIAAALLRNAPDLIINAAAYTAVDRAECDVATAFAVNEYGPSLLAAASSRVGTPLIHVSTDYVFEGSHTTPYCECDPVAPINAYGRSKAAGEAAVRLRQPRHVIVRTSWVHASHGRNFVRTVLRLAAERDEIAVVADQLGTPTAAASIAAAVVTISQRIGVAWRAGREAPWGTYHFTDQGETTWYGLANHVFSYLEQRGMYRPRIKAITTSEYPTPARRPANSRLDCTLMEHTFGIARAPWQWGVDRVLGELLGKPKSNSTPHQKECLP